MSLRRGDENRPQRRILASTRLDGTALPGSLSEGAGSPQGLTEGVSSDGCSMPTIYTPAHFGSEIFEHLRSSKYTPSVSHSLDSSLREGAGTTSPQCQSPARWISRQRAGDFCGFWVGGMLCHSTGYSLKSGVAGDFHRPYEAQKFLHFTIQWPTERVTKETRNQYEIS